MITMLGVAVLAMGGIAVSLHLACRRILRRQFDEEYCVHVVRVKNLEFLDVRRVLEDFTAPLNFLRLRTMLSHDFQKLLGLVETVPPLAGSHWAEAWLPVLYFRLVFGWVMLSRLVGLAEKPGLMKLTAVLQYLASLTGERINWVQITNPAFADLFAHRAGDETEILVGPSDFAPVESVAAPRTSEQDRLAAALLGPRDSGGFASSW